MRIFVGFQLNDIQKSHNLSNDSFHRQPVKYAQCIIGTEKKPAAGVLLNYADDGCSHGYGTFKEAFRALKKKLFFNRTYLNPISDL